MLAPKYRYKYFHVAHDCFQNPLVQLKSKEGERRRERERLEVVDASSLLGRVRRIRSALASPCPRPERLLDVGLIVYHARLAERIMLSIYGSRVD